MHFLVKIILSQYIAKRLLSLPKKKDPAVHPLRTKDMEMGAPHSRSGLCNEQNIFLHGMEPRSLSQQPNEYIYWLYYSGSRFLAG